MINACPPKKALFLLVFLFFCSCHTEEPKQPENNPLQEQTLYHSPEEQRPQRPQVVLLPSDAF